MPPRASSCPPPARVPGRTGEPTRWGQRARPRLHYTPMGYIMFKKIKRTLRKKQDPSLLFKDLKKIKAIEISPKRIITIKPNCTIKEAIEKMKKSKAERLPVIHENKLVGIITIKDILNFNPEVYPEIEEFAKVREESEKLKRIKKAEGKGKEGICEECGHEGILFRINGMLICESCRDSI